MTLTALLLVGGQSRRMGRDKATLRLAGEPLWQRQLRLLQELQPQHLLVSARTRPAWCPAAIEVILDEPPSRGPLSGIDAALARLETSHLLALAIDLPRMTAAHLQHLLALLQPGCGVVPVKDGLFEPLCAVYPTQARVAAAEALQKNQLSLQQLVTTLLERNQVRVHPVSERDKALYFNANTPPASGLSEAVSG